MLDYNCTKHGLVKGSGNGIGKRRCSVCNSERVMARQKALKEKAISLKGGRCEFCGYNKCIAALEFHHLDPEKKESHPNKITSWSKLEKEIEGCILLCSNCHREVHHS